MNSALRNAVKTIVKVANPDKIILFGSHASGKQKPSSDYDLLVIKKDLRNQRELVHNIYLSFRNIGAPIDVIAIDMDRFEELKDDPYLIYSEAYQSGKVIYEKTAKSNRVATTGKK